MSPIEVKNSQSLPQVDQSLNAGSDFWLRAAPEEGFSYELLVGKISRLMGKLVPRSRSREFGRHTTASTPSDTVAFLVRVSFLFS